MRRTSPVRDNKCYSSNMCSFICFYLVNYFGNVLYIIFFVYIYIFYIYYVISPRRTGGPAETGIASDPGALPVMDVFGVLG
jgi:hypothetical protein